MNKNKQQFVKIPAEIFSKTSVLEAKEVVLYSVIACLINKANFSKKLTLTENFVSRYTKECVTTLNKYFKSLQEKNYLINRNYIQENEGEKKSQSTYFLYSQPMYIDIKKYSKSDKISQDKLYYYQEPHENFIMVNVDVLLNDELGMNAKYLYILMQIMKNKANRTYISVPKIMFKMNVGRIAYRTAMSELKQKGLIKRKRDTLRIGVVYFYTLITPVKIKDYSEYFNHNKQKVKDVLRDYRLSYITKKHRAKKLVIKCLEKIISTDLSGTIKSKSIALIMNDLREDLTVAKLKQLSYVAHQKNITNENYIFKALGI